MQRNAVTISLVGLLLCSIAVHSQQGMLCGPIPPDKPAMLCMSESPPIYPLKAKAAGIEGTVVLLAQINKSGRIDWARVVSGPEPLRQAAVDAVNAWIYRPYLIDGSRAGFRTTIKVKFTLERPPAPSPPQN
jgi:TonB family protein